MKKIGFYGDSILLQQAGISHYNSMLLDWFSNSFADEELISILPFEASKIKGQTKVISLKKWPLHQRFRSLVNIPNYVNKNNFDLVIEPAHFGPLRIKPATKRVTVIHDLSPINHPRFHPWLSTFMHKRFIKRILEKTDLIIVNSETTKQEVSEFNPALKNKICVLYPIIETEKKVNSIGCRKLEDPYLLSVGTIEPRKNYEFLIDVYTKFAEREPQFKLVILGADGWKNKSFYNKLKALNNPNIILTGYVSSEDKQSWYKHAAAYLSPSYYEGFGLPVLEAMSFDLPLFLSNISAYQEIGSPVAQLLEMELSAWSKALVSNLGDKKPALQGHLDKLKNKREAQSKALKNAIDSLMG